MMYIKQVPNGKWTVVDEQGAVKLRVETGTTLTLPDGNRQLTAPKYCNTREEVKEICNSMGLYEVKAGNPDKIPEGALVELVIGGSHEDK